MRIRFGWNENENWGQVRVKLGQAENWFKMNTRKKGRKRRFSKDIPFW